MSIAFVLAMFGNAACIAHKERLLGNLGISKKSSQPLLRHAAELHDTARTLLVVPLIFLNSMLMAYIFVFG